VNRILANHAEPYFARQNEPDPAPGNQTQIPRTAPCPCGSGLKYKRCCGVGAPPVLSY